MKPAADIRQELQAAAAGKRGTQPANALDDSLVNQHQRAFQAWKRFATTGESGRGEALAAPAELLPPLP